MHAHLCMSFITNLYLVTGTLNNRNISVFICFARLHHQLTFAQDEVSILSTSKSEKSNTSAKGLLGIAKKRFPAAFRACV